LSSIGFAAIFATRRAHSLDLSGRSSDFSVTDHMPEAYRDHFVLKVRRMSKTFQDTSIDFFGCAGAVNMRR
jgi:hypothetical protein